MKIIEKLWNYPERYGKIIRYNTNFTGSDSLNYKFNVKNIGEGIELCSVNANGFKTSCISVNFTVPLSEKASAFALVSSILTRSSEKYPSVNVIERKSASLYGAEINTDVTKTGENQVIKFSVSCIDDRFALDGESIVNECAEFLFELLFKPNFVNGVFKKDEVESEKRILLEQLASEISDKRIYAKTRCEEIMFADEVYGINRLGTEDSIKAVTEKSLADAYFELLSTAYISVCVSGNNTDSDSVGRLFLEYFPETERKPSKAETLFVESSEDIQYEKETQSVKQGKLVMGFRLGMTSSEDEYGARRVMVDLFGGSPHSKLFTVVREKMSLCYYCSARMYRAKGYMLVQSGIETYNEEKAKNGILEQLEDIKNGNFTDDAISSSVKALTDGFKSVSDTPESLDYWFMSQSASGKYLYPEDFIKQFESVTREDIIKAAKAVTLDTVFMLAGDGTEAEGEE